MANRYALVRADGLVDNVIEWDGVEPWTPPDGLEPIEAEPRVSPGWRYEGGEWLAPEGEG